MSRTKRCFPPPPDNTEQQPCKVRLMELDPDTGTETLSTIQTVHAATITSTASSVSPTPTADKSNSSVSNFQPETTETYSEPLFSSLRSHHSNNRCQERKALNSKDFYTPHCPNVHSQFEPNKSPPQQVEIPHQIWQCSPPQEESSPSLKGSTCRDKNSPNSACNHSDEDMLPSSRCQNILELPNSILLYIFQYLTISQRLCCVALVCTKWYELSKDPSLWRIICFQDLTHMCITDEILDKVTSYSNHVIHLDLSNIMGFTLNGISSLLKKCRHLIYLSLKGCCCLPDSAFRLISQHLPDLQQLYLDDCFAVTNETMIEIFINCSKLTHVSVSSHLNSKAVLTLASHCPGLKLLHISYCEAVDALAELFQKCKQLENINISNCPLTDQHLMHLSKLSNLKHIYLNSVNMSSNAAKEIAKNCTQLQTMSLCFNDCVDDDCIATVARYARNLKVLKCIRCSITDQGLTAIGQNCHNLQKLDVSFCNQISNEGVNFVSNKCGKLHFLGLFSCENVDTDFLLALEKNYPDILFYCFNLEYNRLIKRASEQGYL